jgi:hypothetical protein
MDPYEQFHLDHDLGLQKPDALELSEPGIAASAALDTSVECRHRIQAFAWIPWLSAPTVDTSKTAAFSFSMNHILPGHGGAR